MQPVVGGFFVSVQSVCTTATAAAKTLKLIDAGNGSIAARER